MVDNVNLASVNGGRVPEWAEERTQQLILDQLETMNNLDVKDRSTTDIIKAIQSGTSLEKDSSKTFTKINTNINKMSAITSRFMKSMIAGGASTEKVFKQGLQGIVSSLEDQTEKLSGATGTAFGIFTAGIGLASVAIGGFTKLITEAGDSFADLYDTGQSLNGSLADVYTQAGKAAMTVGMFTEAISQNSEAVKSLETQFMSGASSFGLMSKNLRQSMQAQGQFMLSIADVNEYLGEYLEIQQLYGHFENRSRRQQEKYVKGYIENLTQLSILTGKRRKQLADEVKTAMSDNNLANFMSTLDPAASEAMTSITASLVAMDASGGLAKAMQEMVMFGTATGEQAIMLSQLGLSDEFHAVAQKINAGISLTAKEEKLLRKEIMDAAARTNDEHLQAIAKGNALGATGLQVYSDTIANVRKINDEVNSDTNLDAVTTLYGAFENLKTNALAPFTELFGTLITRFSEFLAADGTIEKISAAFQNVADVLDRTLTSDTFEGTLTTLVGWFQELVDVLAELISGEFSFKNVIKDSIRNKMDPANIGMTDDQQDEFNKRRNEKDNMGVSSLKTAFPALRILDWINDSIQARMGGGSNASVDPNATPVIGGPRRSLRKNARGGVAKQASIFGEAGPEAAIPLDSGLRIPIAQIEGDFNKSEFRQMITGIEKTVDRLETQANQQEKVIQRLDKINASISRGGNAII